MDNRLIKNTAVNSSVRNGDNYLQISDNCDPKQEDLCNISKVILTSHTPTVTPQNMILGGVYSTHNFSYKIFENSNVFSILQINHDINYLLKNKFLRILHQRFKE
jgi:hypothetical protein